MKSHKELDEKKASRWLDLGGGRHVSQRVDLNDETMLLTYVVGEASEGKGTRVLDVDKWLEEMHNEGAKRGTVVRSVRGGGKALSLKKYISNNELEAYLSGLGTLMGVSPKSVSSEDWVIARPRSVKDALRSDWEMLSRDINRSTSAFELIFTEHRRTNKK